MPHDDRGQQRGISARNRGGIVFYGGASGCFVAVDERDGKPSWRVPLNGIIKTSPMTFAVGGRQHIALAVGPRSSCSGCSRGG